MIDVTSRPSTCTCSICFAVIRPLCCVSATFTCVPLASTTTVSPRLPRASVSVPTERRSPALRTTSLRSQRPEVGHLDPNGVLAWLQVGDLKAAVAVADRDARIVVGFVDDGQRRAGQDLALGIGDVTRDGAADGLRRRLTRHAEAARDSNSQRDNGLAPTDAEGHLANLLRQSGRRLVLTWQFGRNLQNLEGKCQ